MKQQTFTDIEYSNRKRITRREEFLNTMDGIIRWDYWTNEIRPYYPAGRRGRPPKDIETMLRMYLMQCWFRLSDAAAEDAVYDSHAMRNFMHLDFLNEQVPGASTLSRFRRLLKANGIDRRIQADICDALQKEGRALRRGEMADPVLVARAKTRE